MESYYLILRIQPEEIQDKEDAEVIKIIEAQYEAAITRAKKVHRSGGQRDEVLKRMDEAREVLSNSEKRKAHDQQLKEMLEEDMTIKIETLPDEVMEAGGLEPIREQEARGNYSAEEKIYFEERLIAAIKQHKVDEVKKIMDEIEGQKLFSTFSDGSSVLGLAVVYHNEKIFENLLQNIADVNARDSFGMTALGEAVGRSNTEVVQQLLGAGAKTENVDGNENSATQYAHIRNSMPNHRMTEILKQAEMKENSDNEAGNKPLRSAAADRSAIPKPTVPKTAPDRRNFYAKKAGEFSGSPEPDIQKNPAAQTVQPQLNTQKPWSSASGKTVESKFVSQKSTSNLEALFNDWKQANPGVEAELKKSKSGVDIKIKDADKRKDFINQWTTDQVMMTRKEFKNSQKQSQNNYRLA